MCRRGSFNGTSSVAAERELYDTIQHWNQNKIQDTLRLKEVEWIFDPPTGSKANLVSEETFEICTQRTG